ncbi:MAG TPA: hypothetical protein DEP51_07505 [Clostridiales bacterium]|nr:hypothetical protein [Clostridiales bacterium]
MKKLNIIVGKMSNYVDEKIMIDIDFFENLMYYKYERILEVFHKYQKNPTLQSGIFSFLCINYLILKSNKSIS